MKLQTAIGLSSRRAIEECSPFKVETFLTRNIGIYTSGKRENGIDVYDHFLAMLSLGNGTQRGNHNVVVQYTIEFQLVALRLF